MGGVQLRTARYECRTGSAHVLLVNAYKVQKRIYKVYARPHGNCPINKTQGPLEYASGRPHIRRCVPHSTVCFAVGCVVGLVALNPSDVFTYELQRGLYWFYTNKFASCFWYEIPVIKVKLV